jgi:hypothetical protein
LDVPSALRASEHVQTESEVEFESERVATVSPDFRQPPGERVRSFANDPRPGKRSFSSGKAWPLGQSLASPDRLLFSSRLQTSTFGQLSQSNASQSPVFFPGVSLHTRLEFVTAAVSVKKMLSAKTLRSNFKGACCMLGVDSVSSRGRGFCVGMYKYESVATTPRLTGHTKMGSKLLSSSFLK